MKKKGNNYLTKIPVLGYFFRKIKENQQEIETTLETGKPTESQIKKKYFLGGLVKIISGKTFRMLKFKEEKEKNVR